MSFTIENPNLTASLGAIAGNLTRGGLAWGTNLRNVTFQSSPPSTFNAVTETQFSPAQLSPTELSKLTTYCQYIKIPGSSVAGICSPARLARGVVPGGR